MQRILTEIERQRLARRLPKHQPGPYVQDGFLGFVLLDGSRVLCQCIPDPWASLIVEACNAGKNAAAADRDTARQADPDQGESGSSDIPSGAGSPVPNEGQAQGG